MIVNELDFLCRHMSTLPMVAALDIMPVRFFLRTSLRFSLSSDTYFYRSARGEASRYGVEMDLSHICVCDGYALAIATPRAIAAASSSEPGSGESRMARPSATKLQPKRTAS